MIEVVFIVNGGRKFGLGVFESAELAVSAIKEHVWENSAITRPRYTKSMSGDSIRIDYGSKDCYYLMTLIKQMEGE